MRKWWVFFVATVAVAAYAQEAPKPARETAQYTNKSWRWSISYPTGWTIDSSNPTFVVIRSAPQNAMCGIHSGPVDRFNTVDELTDFLLAHDEKFFKGKGQKFTVVTRKRIKLPNGIVGNDVLAEIGPGGRSRRIHVLADGRGLAVDCEGYTKSWSKLEVAYQRIIASFTVRK
jgi:hypothetical protein